MRSRLALLALLLAAGCGKQQPLHPAAGKALPQKPATSAVQPDGTALLRVPAPLRPGRVDELVIKSQTRPDDKFDLPPR